MRRLLLPSLFVIIAVMASYFSFRDRSLEPSQTEKIAEAIELDNFALSTLKKDTVYLMFQSEGECGNDPRGHLYAKNWDSVLTHKLTTSGFKNVFVLTGAQKYIPGNPVLSIDCYIENNDFFSTKVVSEIKYQNNLDLEYLNTEPIKYALKYRGNSWLPATRND